MDRNTMNMRRNASTTPHSAHTSRNGMIRRRSATTLHGTSLDATTTSSHIAPKAIMNTSNMVSTPLIHPYCRLLKSKDVLTWGNIDKKHDWCKDDGRNKVWCAREHEAPRKCKEKYGH